jgi:hypothetical protein
VDEEMIYMARSTVIFLGLLTAACLTPIQAQDNPFNFNIGAGIGTPLNPTAQYAGLSGNFVVGAGYNIDKNNSIVGQFMWQGLPPSRLALKPLINASGLNANANLYSLTANYKYRVEGHRFGGYVIAGGGWYYRYASLDRNNVVAGGTVCQPIYGYWGYGCEAGYVTVDNTLLYNGASAFGANAGIGMTIRIADSGLKFYMESRYHYAGTQNVNTQVVPVTFGFQW